MAERRSYQKAREYARSLGWSRPFAASYPLAAFVIEYLRIERRPSVRSPLRDLAERLDIPLLTLRPILRVKIDQVLYRRHISEFIDVVQEEAAQETAEALGRCATLVHYIFCETDCETVGFLRYALRDFGAFTAWRRRNPLGYVSSHVFADQDLLMLPAREPIRTWTDLAAWYRRAVETAVNKAEIDFLDNDPHRELETHSFTLRRITSSKQLAGAIHPLRLSPWLLCGLTLERFDHDTPEPYYVYHVRSKTCETQTDYFVIANAYYDTTVVPAEHGDALRAHPRDGAIMQVRAETDHLFATLHHERRLLQELE